LIPFSAITLKTEIGHGGYGVVYLSELSGTSIAVKKVDISGIKKSDLNEITALR